MNLILTHAVAALAAFAAGWQVHVWKTDSEDLKDAQQADVRRLDNATLVESSASKVEDFKQKERIKYVYITKEVERVQATPFYAPGQQCFDDDGLRIIREAIGNPAPASSAASAVREVTSP
jgi:hypothetical protein